MKQPKQYLLAAFILLLTLSLTACKAEKPLSISTLINRNEFSTSSSNSVIHQAQADAPDDTLLYVMNQPTDDEMTELLSYQIVKIDSEAPTTLLAPCEQNTNLKIFSLNYNEENKNYERDIEVWSLEDSGKGLILAVQLNYGSANQPTYELYIESGDSYGSYFFELPDEPETLPHFDYLIKQGTVINLKGLD